jgi:shikimate kinase
MQLVFVYGPPAAGKYTVSRKLAELTGLPLFQNHLIVDAVAALFPFGSGAFVRLRELFWLEAIGAAAREGRSFIFTFQPEASVSPDFAARVVKTVNGAGGKVTFVHLTLSAEGQAARIANEDRGRFGKLRDVELLRTLQAEFAACEQAMPAADIVIDTEQTPPDAAAAEIFKRLQSGRAGE